MKKIKFMMLAMMAIMVSVGFTACSDDDDPVSNMEQYQRTVDATVKAQKKSNKAILLVAFGSTWQQAYDAFDETVEAYKSAFSGYDVYLSFSSAICINRAAAGENVAPRNFYAPQFWLEAFGRVQYDEVIVQSLQVIPGEEFSRVVNAMKDFANNSNGDIDDEYLSKMTLKLGQPLMASADEDVENLAKAINTNFSAQAAKGVVAFMGHGNPDEYDTYKANVRYTQLEKALQKINKNYSVGTVDMSENYKTNVKDRMQDAGITSGTVYCAPLMSIAGDHAHNDMAGDDDEWEFNDENGEMEGTSWKVYFADQRGGGYTCNDETMLNKGLLEYANVRQLWMNHTRNAEAVDYYHSKNPE
ncbi:MAG: sirohydrochlorin cobaltochelatase [Bacteroidaceae bacterium]|nr:sirohydrochlorin cobaltochelatase [Bacteroidaceae bacterium]